MGMQQGSLAQKILHATRGQKLIRRGDVGVRAGYDQIGRALKRLENEGRLERVGRGVWRRLSNKAPRLVHPRTWSRPSGVRDDILIAATLARPTFEDLLRLTLAFGMARVRRALEQLAGDGDITARVRDADERMLNNIARGFSAAVGRGHARRR